MMTPTLRSTARAVFFIFLLIFSNFTFAQIRTMPVMALEPAELSFGRTGLNKTGDMILTISNIGVSNLNISNILLDNPSFKLIGGNVHVVAPQRYKLLTIRFTPLVLEAQIDTLRIFSNDSTGKITKIPVSGVGASTALPEISVQPAEIKFDSVQVKSAQTLTMRVYNRGAANLNVTGVASSHNRFEVVSAKNFILTPNDSGDIAIKFNPLLEGLQAAILTIKSNDPNENPLNLKLSGMGKPIPAPALTKIFPVSGKRLQSFDLSCKGKNFLAGFTGVNVGPNITVNKITVHHPDSLTANITIAANAAIGPRDFLAINTGPGGGISGKQIFTVENPAPILTQLNPMTASRLQKISVGFKGANFFNGATTANVSADILVNNLSVQRSDSLTVTMTIMAEATLGARAISVSNSAPGGGNSTAQSFTINNPAPILTSITPAKGGRASSLKVTFKGANFIAGVTKVNVGEGIQVDSLTVTSATSLTASLSILPTAANGARDFSVMNPGPGGGTSSVQNFSISNPSPVLMKISPASGGLLQTLDVGFKGANFLSGISSVNVGPDIAVNRVTVHRSDSLTANITIGAEALLGARSFFIINSEPGGGKSLNQIFIVGKPAPILTALTPAAGSRFQTLNVGCKGANFVDGLSSINFGPNVLINKVTVQRADSLTANITINVNAVAGPRNVTVSNGTGLTSENHVFTVTNPTPSLTKLNPAGGVRLEKVIVGFKGAYFIGGVSRLEVGPNITVNNLVVHSPDSMTAGLLIKEGASAGPRNFAVVNNGGLVSNLQTFIVHNPAPVLKRITLVSGAPLQTLHVGFTGDNFFTGATTVSVGAGITVNNLVVHRLDSLTATITIAANATPGLRQFSVANASPGGGVSAGAIFTVMPTPILTRINPVIGKRLQTLDVGFKGQNFHSSLSEVMVGPNIIVNRVTVQRTDSLTANITIGPNAELGTRNFAVSNGEGAVSDNQIFSITNPIPILQKIEPAHAFRKQRVDIVFIGANFINKSTVVNVGPGIVINSIIVPNATSLIANITITPDAERGPRNFSLTNIAPAGGKSAEQLFLVTNNDPSQPRLLSPANNELVQLNKQKPLKFLWSRSFDNDKEDTVKYVINLKGPELDLSFPAVRDTSASLNIMSRLKVNSTYSWDLKVSDGVVTVTWPNRATFRTSSTITSVQEDNNLVPGEFHLEQNYPNPFTLTAKYAETTIKYQLPKESFVTLKVFDMLGREMIALVNALQPPGYYNVTWNGRNTAGQLVPGGIYLCRLQAGSFERVMKMMIVR
jgi:hypothetical protein